MQTYLKDLRWGKFNLIQGDMISNISAHYGEWSDVEVTIFHSLLTPNANVIEVGSNIGMHAVPIAKAIPQGKLLCFEPQRIIFQQLCCNLSLNNLTNVETYRMGVCDVSEKRWIESCDYSQPWNYGSFSLDKGFSTEAQFNGSFTQEEIDTVRLDDFAPAQRLEQLSLLKIDAEGFDIPVLKGATKLIERLKPAIFIEVHSYSVEKTLAIIHQLNYEAYWVASQRYQQNNFYNAEKLDDGYDLNLLCFPNNDANAQHSTAQHSTAQHNTAQHSTTQQKIFALKQLLIKAISLEQLTNGEVPLLLKEEK
ncbi:FkbM family methyltransferase [Ursidibacter arcticus]